MPKLPVRPTVSREIVEKTQQRRSEIGLKSIWSVALCPAACDTLKTQSWCEPSLIKNRRESGAVRMDSVTLCLRFGVNSRLEFVSLIVCLFIPMQL